MKTQSIGKSECASAPCARSLFCTPLILLHSVSRPQYAEALQQYKTARENGEQADSPKNAFPSAGLETLKITGSTNSAKGWPDAQKRYWWKLSLEDGSTNEEFAFEGDNARGYPDKSDSNRYWFIIHGPNGVKMEGFSWETDYQKGFPDSSGNYWRYVRYTECGPIKEWMLEKDRNYLARLEREKAPAAQSSSSSPSSAADVFSFSKPFKLSAANKAAIAPGLINNSFLCPITHEIMLDPVLATDGHTYEREVILQALEKGNAPSGKSTALLDEKSAHSNGKMEEDSGSFLKARYMLSPMTGQPMESKSVFPNHSMRSMIRDFLTQHPECWQEVYVSTAAVNELLVLSLSAASLDLQKWESILRADPRLLTLPLQGVTLLEFLCKQTESVVKTYLPALLNLLTPKDWQDLIRIYSAQDWLKLAAQTCERCAAPELAAEFLNKLRMGLGIKAINPLEMALYALEQKHLGLFKLALSQLKDVNEAVDSEKNTLLHLAARQGQTEMVQCLVNRGAYLKQRNAAGLKAEGVARLAGFEAMADQIAVFKLTPVLERMGFFTGLRRLETMEKELGQLEALKKEMHRLETEVQELRTSTSGPSGYAKKI
jgi:hypothetical protein